MTRLFLAVSLSVVTAATAARATTFDFGPYAPTNGTVPLVITNDGLTATFSSPSGPQSFIAEDGSAFSTLGSSVLADDNFVPEELDVSFGAPVRSVWLAFATNDFGSPSTMTLTVLDGATVAGTVSAIGAIANSGLPEGVLGFSGGPFTSIALTDPESAGFAIGQFSASVPEPASLAILAAGLIGIAALRRRAA
nr:PEP-CTERM sorting domain-containing protein [uncultured Rhodopila sp.]